MFPIRDENPRLRFPVGTVAVISVCAVSWVFLQGLGMTVPLAKSMCTFALIPADLVGTASPGTRLLLGANLVCVLDGQNNWYTVLSSMFMHGGWFHLVGNLWFLWVFADNVEDAMGTVRFIVFYLLCGIAAAAAQVLTDVNSAIPMVGASGAIGGVMGAYALLYPRVRVQLLIFLGFFVTTIAVPAVYMLGYWFLLQLLGGLPALSSGSQGGVAFWAHIGGFLAGLALCPLFVNNEYLATQRSLQRRLAARHRW